MNDLSTMQSIPRPRIISGGQTGADRGALDAAIELGLEWGGHCPAKWLAEDGEIPEVYRENLKRTRAKGYLPRTLQNVKNAQATVIFVARTTGLTPGSAKTIEYCEKMDRPHLLMRTKAAHDIRANGLRLRRWLKEIDPKTLNVAGSRESVADGIQQRVKAILTTTFSLA